MIEVFNKTCSVFQTAVRNGRTLQEVVCSPTEDQHFWTLYTHDNPRTISAAASNHRDPHFLRRTSLTCAC